MKGRNPIFIETEAYIIKEALVDADGETVWDVKDCQTNKSLR